MYQKSSRVWKWDSLSRKKCDHVVVLSLKKYLNTKHVIHLWIPYDKKNAMVDQKRQELGIVRLWEQDSVRVGAGQPSPSFLYSVVCTHYFTISHYLTLLSFLTWKCIQFVGRSLKSMISSLLMNKIWLGACHISLFISI